MDMKYNEKLNQAQNTLKALQGKKSPDLEGLDECFDTLSLLVEQKLLEYAVKETPLASPTYPLKDYCNFIFLFAKPPHCYPPSVSVVRAWLQKEGYLQTVVIRGKPKKIPTKKGLEMGFVPVEITKNGATRLQFELNTKGQYFVKTHLTEIFSL